MNHKNHKPYRPKTVLVKIQCKHCKKKFHLMSREKVEHEVGGVTRVYVLSAERYHESGTILGAFLDLDKAVEAFSNAKNIPESPGDYTVEGWQLQAFENDKALKQLFIMTSHVLSATGFHNKIVRMIYPHTDQCQCEYEEVDPLKYDWVNYEAIELEKRWNPTSRVYEVSATKPIV